MTGWSFASLEYFLAVADNLSFTGPPNGLHVVQSGVSATIKALERELGADLFVRGPAGVALTPAGRELATPCPRDPRRRPRGQRRRRRHPGSHPRHGHPGDVDVDQRHRPADAAGRPLRPPSRRAGPVAFRPSRFRGTASPASRRRPRRRPRRFARWAAGRPAHPTRRRLPAAAGGPGESPPRRAGVGANGGAGRDVVRRRPAGIRQPGRGRPRLRRHRGANARSLWRSPISARPRPTSGTASASAFSAGSSSTRSTIPVWRRSGFPITTSAGACTSRYPRSARPARPPEPCSR